MVVAFAVAAIAMLIALIPAGIVLVRDELVSAVVAYEFITSVAVMVLALLAQAFQRPSLFEPSPTR
jgi:multisubunit Na+/H+ antiporter MnhF subunit